MRLRKGLPIFITGALFLASLWVLGGSPPEEEKEVAKYMGIKGCRTCHKSKKIGNQVGIWEASGHARAYEALESPKADSLAKALGMESPNTNPGCLKCHTTAFGAPSEILTRGYKQEEGVQCEACHGPGSLYRSLKVMKDHDMAVEKGLWVLGEKSCRSCHTDECHEIRPFAFKERMKKIDHPVPKPDTSATPDAQIQERKGHGADTSKAETKP